MCGVKIGGKLAYSTHVIDGDEMLISDNLKYKFWGIKYWEN